MVDERYEWLFSGKRLIVSQNTTLLVKLAILAVKRAIEYGIKPAIVDESGYLVRYLPLELLDEISLFTDVSSACNSDYVVLLLSRLTRRLETCRSRTVLVFSRPSQYYLSGYSKIYVSKIAASNEVIARLPEDGVVVRFTITNDKIVAVSGPPGIYGRAYEVLRNAMSDYGEISLRDAVRILMIELGVDKTKAKNILSWLAKCAYIRVVKGKLSLV